jgi:hypothetical protein
MDNLLPPSSESDLLDEEKRNTLKEFNENPGVLDETATVLNVSLAGLNSCGLPEDGVTSEMGRHTIISTINTAPSRSIFQGFCGNR